MSRENFWFFHPFRVRYSEIDDYLEGREVSTEAAARIEQLWDAGQHKRHLPATLADDWWRG